MKVLIAPNSFKQCLSASQVARAIARGVASACPGAAIKIIPLADGGDGLLDASRLALGGELVEESTLDALERPIKAFWLKAGATAVIELAQVCGLARLKGPGEYDPMRSSTRGAGIMILRALDRLCRRVVIGLGGSASVDAGCGMAAALGARFLDRRSRPLPPGGGALARLERIDTAGLDRRMRRARVVCLADVRNRLLGPFGAARFFGPQKGAGSAEVARLERNLARWAAIVKRDMGIDVLGVAGGGAAGGAGAGCAAFFGARPRGGAAWVAHQAGLARAAAEADIVFTGEGKIDEQTAFGKIPAYVGRLAKKKGKPVFALGGSVAPGLDLTSCGITDCIAVTPPGMALDEAFRRAEKNLATASARVMMQIGGYPACAGANSKWRCGDA